MLKTTLTNLIGLLLVLATQPNTFSQSGQYLLLRGGDSEFHFLDESPQGNTVDTVTSNGEDGIGVNGQVRNIVSLVDYCGNAIDHVIEFTGSNSTLYDPCSPDSGRAFLNVNNPNFALENGDFTFEFKVKFKHLFTKTTKDGNGCYTQLADEHCVFDYYSRIVGHLSLTYEAAETAADNYGQNGRWEYGQFTSDGTNFEPGTVTKGRGWVFEYRDQKTNRWYELVAVNDFTMDTAWHHIILTRNGNTYSIYQDGILIAQNNFAIDFNFTDHDLKIGYSADDRNQLNGYLDNFIFQKGEDLYAEEPPSVDPEDGNFQYNAFCAEDVTNNVPVSVTTPGGQFSFLNNPNGAQINQNTGAITGAISGETYTVQYISPGICPGVETRDIQLLPTPEVTIDPILSLCESDVEIALTGNVEGVFSMDANPLTHINPVNLGPGTHTVTLDYTNTHGCSNSANHSFQVHTAPVIALNHPTSITLCQGTDPNITLSATGVGVHTWGEFGTGNEVTVDVSNTNEIILMVEENGCISTEVISIEHAHLPEASLHAPSQEICFGEDGQYLITGQPNLEVTYLLNGVLHSNTLDPTGLLEITQPGLTEVSNLELLSALDTQSGCFQDIPSNATIDVLRFPTNIGLTPTHQSDCSQETDGSLTVHGDNITEYTLLSEDSTWMGSSPNGVFNDLAAGAYIVVATNGSCASSGFHALIESEEPYAINIDLNGLAHPSECGMSNGEIILTEIPEGIYTISYTNPQGQIINHTDMSIDSTGYFLLNNMEGGSYTNIQVINETTNCSSSNSVDVTLETPASPSISMMRDTTICIGDSVFLGSTGTHTPIIWENDLANRTWYTPAEVGVHELSATSNSGNCTTTETVTIIVSGNPIIGIQNERDTLCSGESTTIRASGGESYLWWNGETTPVLQIAPLSDTSFSLTVESTYGCESDTLLTLFVTPTPELEIVSLEDTLACVGDTISMEASGNGEIHWSTGQIGENITLIVTEEMVLTATVTAACGTSIEATGNIRVAEYPTIDIGDDVTIETDEDYEIIVYTELDNIIFWPNSDSLSCNNCFEPLANPEETTVYTAIVTNPYGCSSSDSIEITVVPDSDIWYPNALDLNTPEESLFSISGGPFTNFKLTIYNRWGEVMFQTFDQNAPWDGTFRSQFVTTGVYTFTCEFVDLEETERFIGGNITVIR